MKYIDDLQVKDLLQDKWLQIAEAIEEAFVDESVIMPEKTYLVGLAGDFRIMPVAYKKYAAAS